MRLLALLSLMVLTMASFSVVEEKSPVGDYKFVQFVVPDIDTPAEAMKVNNFMNKQAGVINARMDHVSKKFLVFFDPSFNYDEAYFTDKFSNLMGADIKCYREGVRGQDEIIDQKLDCE